MKKYNKGKECECECGCSYFERFKTHHLKTEFHNKFMEYNIKISKIDESKYGFNPNCDGCIGPIRLKNGIYNKDNTSPCSCCCYECKKAEIKRDIGIRGSPFCGIHD